MLSTTAALIRETTAPSPRDPKAHHLVEGACVGPFETPRGVGVRYPVTARSLPVPLVVLAERVGEAGIDFAAPDGPFGESQAPPQVGEPGGPRDGVDGLHPAGDSCEEVLHGVR